MRIRIDVSHMVLHEAALTRPARATLHADIAQELGRLLAGQPEPRRRPVGSVDTARRIAAAVHAQLPSAPTTRGRRR
jgi:hypothetical protein